MGAARWFNLGGYLHGHAGCDGKRFFQESAADYEHGV